MKRFIACAVAMVICLSTNACGNKISVDNKLDNSTFSKEIKPLEALDFTVTNGKSSIKLDSLYKDFKIDKSEEKIDNNYVGETYAGEFIYKTYMHKFDDFDLYVSNSNYNLKNRGFDAYYITQITLKNSNFKTLRGIKIGSDIEDVKNTYGSTENSNIAGKTNWIYKFDDREMSFMIGENQKVQGIVFSVIVASDKMSSNDSKLSTEMLNSFFFKSNTSQLNYKGKLSFNDTVEEVAKLHINEIANLKYGKLFELKLNPMIDVPSDRLSLGYFYVQKDKIYKIEPTEKNINQLKTSEELPDESVIVCQDQEIKDMLSKDEPGLHQYLKVNGVRREYHAYSNKVSTGYYESFIWEKNKGLINYRSGYGAERDSIELQQ